MLVATWNVNSLRVRLPQVLAWLETESPDIVALQETKIPDPEFPAAEFLQRGYQLAIAGQKTYNGVAILSRTPLSAPCTEIPGYSDPQRRVVYAETAAVSLLNLYVPNGSEVGSEKYSYKLGWLRHVRDYVRELMARQPRLVVLGDFNIAPADADVHDPAAWAGQVLCSEPERAEFSALLKLGLVDCFRKFPQPEGSFTWWDYRAAGFRRNLGLRIDHILAAPELARRCRSCRIDRTPRTWERPSDHTPVLAEFAD
jgi:exodeoxyribonuclease-3